MNYKDIKERGTKRTVISFDPFFDREDVRSLTNAQIEKEFGLSAKTVRSMRCHQEVPFDTIQKICHKLECQPGDILDATSVWVIPPTKKGPDA